MMMIGAIMSDEIAYSTPTKGRRSSESSGENINIHDPKAILYSCEKTSRVIKRLIPFKLTINANLHYFQWSI